MAKKLPEWSEAFLAALRNSANVRASCLAAQISRKEAYKRRADTPAFAEAWDDAVEDALDALEAEAWRRARAASDFLLWKLLASRRRSVYSDRVVQDVTLTGGVAVYLPERKAE